MNVYSNQFHQQVERNGLAPFTMIFGDEPQQKFDCIEMIRTAAKAAGFDERECFTADKQFDWQSLLDSGMNLSLFASKKLVEIELPDGKPGTVGSKALIQLTQQPAEDTIYLLHGGKIGKEVQKTKWYKAFDNQGISTTCYPLEGSRFEQWIQQRFSQHQRSADRDSVAFIADFCEGNMLAAAQEIEKLCILSDKPQFDYAWVKMQCSNHSRFNVFQLIDTLLIGDSTRAIKILSRLESEGIEPNQILWFLIKESNTLRAIHSQHHQGKSLSTIYSELRIWSSKQGMYSSALQRVNVELLEQLQAKLSALDVAMKSMVLPRPYIDLVHVSLLFCGYDLNTIALDYDQN